MQAREKIASVLAKMTDDKYRYRFEITALNFLFFVLAFVMTILNIVTKKGALIYFTGVFSALSLIYFFMSLHKKIKMVFLEILFMLNVYSLFLVLLISGNPDGFSALWISFLPALSMILFGWKKSTIYSLGMFLCIVFFFWTGFGRSLLQYSYQETFMMRFPIFYIAFYFVSLFLELIRANTSKELVVSKENYHYLYNHDFLTEINNRYGFNESLNDTIQKMQAHDSLLFLILDIDDFKKVNDSFGHLIGDVVLKEVGKIISRECGNKATCCRWGGEEFAAFKRIVDSEDVSYDLAHNICREISLHSFIIEGHKEIKITCSIGSVYAFRPTSNDISEIIKQTDQCLYRAKEMGKNRVIFSKFKKREEHD